MLYLIDTENISLKKLLEVARPERKDEVIFFYSGVCPSMPIKLGDYLERVRAKVKYKEVIVGKPNALDFQLVSYMGYLLRLSRKSRSVCIVSGDKGFECVAEFWNLQGYDVKVIHPPNECQEENRARQKMLSIQKQDLSSKLFTTIYANKERWAVVNFVMNPKNSKTDINVFLTKQYSGKKLRNINNIIKPYIANRAG